MKYVTYGQKPTDTCKIGIVDYCGQPTLAVVDENGNYLPGGLIGSITKEGKLELHCVVNEKFGFDQNKSGYINIVKNGL